MMLIRTGCFVAVAAVLALCGIAEARPAANPTIEMTVANRGTVTLELYAADAPKTVAHFVDLCKRGFYDGMLFHRVVPGFVAQAGDPKSKTFTPKQVADADDGNGGTTGLGNGGSGKNIPFEENQRTHEEGTLGMALSGARTATGDSQFFINLKANHRLDGDYCVFGKVVKGMEVVQKIARGDKITKAKLITPKQK